MLVHTISVLNVFVKSLWKVSQKESISECTLSVTNVCVRWVSGQSSGHADENMGWNGQFVGSPGCIKQAVPAACLLSASPPCKGVARWLLPVLLPVFSPLCTGQSPEPSCSIHRTRWPSIPRAGKGLSELIPTLKFTFLLYFCFVFSLRVKCQLWSL